MYKKIFIATLLLLVFLPTHFGRAEKINIALDKTIFSFSANPGSSNEIKFKISNILSEPQDIFLVSKDFLVGENSSVLSTSDRNENFGMKDWILFDQQNYVLGPQETKEIKLSINIPQDASLGAHYAIVGVQALPKSDSQDLQKTIVGGQIGVYILLNVNGETSGSGNLVGFHAPIIAGKNIAFEADFENTGNIIYIPHGEIQIKNLFTRKNTVIDVEKHFVFPKSKYSFKANWNTPSIFGLYSARASFIDANGVNYVKKRIIFSQFLFFVFLILLLICSFFLYYKMKKR